VAASPDTAPYLHTDDYTLRALPDRRSGGRPDTAPYLHTDDYTLCGVCGLPLSGPGEPCPRCALLDEQVGAALAGRRPVASGGGERRRNDKTPCEGVFCFVEQMCYTCLRTKQNPPGVNEGAFFARPGERSTQSDIHCNRSTDASLGQGWRLLLFN
jgi:hypothetical protein